MKNAVADILESPIYKYITLAANKCGYSGTSEDLIVNHVHYLILKDKATEIKDYNTNWSESTTGTFVNKYWKATKTEIENLRFMGAWDISDQDDNMNIIQS